MEAAVHITKVVVPKVVLADDHQILAGAIRLHFLDWGTASKPPLVLLHGGGLTAHTWDIVCQGLRERFHCVAPDLRGHGDSEWSSNMDYSLETLADDLEHLVNMLGFDQFVLAGMSMGGLTSILYASRHPGRVKGLVLIDVGPEVKSAAANHIVRFVGTSEELDSAEGFVERAAAFNPTRHPVLLRRSVMHNVHQLPNGTWAWKYDKRHWGRKDFQVSEARRRLLWKEVSTIHCPTLVVRGANSDVFSDADAERLAAALSQGRWVRVKGAGHSIPGDNPKGLLDALTPFLDTFA